jgi:hypothetical protein
MAALLFRRDVETLAVQQGMRPSEGLVLRLGCHPAAGVRIAVLKDRDDWPGAPVVHVSCWQCQTALVDIAVEEPVTTPRRCDYHRGPSLAYMRGEVMLVCEACDRALFLATVARREAYGHRTLP